MAPRNMTKKADVLGEGSNPNANILSDTTPGAIDTVKSWTQVFEILEHEVINCPGDFYNEVDDTHGTKLRIISQSELQNIVV
jgi:hypothetical protein